MCAHIWTNGTENKIMQSMFLLTETWNFCSLLNVLVGILFETDKTDSLTAN